MDPRSIARAAAAAAGERAGGEGTEDDPCQGVDARHLHHEPRHGSSAAAPASSALSCLTCLACLPQPLAAAAMAAWYASSLARCLPAPAFALCAGVRRPQRLAGRPHPPGRRRTGPRGGRRLLLALPRPDVHGGSLGHRRRLRRA
ncbi:hypothetical protein PAHAL_4G325600 [Panicum hallii]|uniref:Uncharacterized protein n=1 Tax=Panicum hallii TaxID=206008 RepID=A0A2T8JER1_9POAL|nr:hypothetical protein PAHAL_4G325600 [Panicum hallii]